MEPPDLTQLASGLLLQGRYRVVELLGQGGMGYVYRAIDTVSNDPVAVKQTFFPGEDRRHWFKNEAEILERLADPSLPKVLTFFAEANLGCFLVMQFVPGIDLTDLVAHTGPLDSSMVVPWIKQLVHVLNYLHTRNPCILHRDIKPKNIKIHGGTLFLLDFGLAKSGDLTVVPGISKNYSSPEQMRGLPTDVRSDLYSLGATFYYIMTGVVPPDSYHERYRARELNLPDPLKPLHQLNSNVAEAVARIIHKAMAMEREDRFLTAAEMQEALDQLGRVEPKELLSNVRLRLGSTSGRSKPAPFPAERNSSGVRILRPQSSPLALEKRIEAEALKAKKQREDLCQVAQVENRTHKRISYYVLNEDNSWTKKTLEPMGLRGSGDTFWRRNMNVVIRFRPAKDSEERHYSLAPSVVAIGWPMNDPHEPNIACNYFLDNDDEIFLNFTQALRVAE